MKVLFYAIAFMGLCISSKAQDPVPVDPYDIGDENKSPKGRMDRYSASNGIVYHVGDSVEIGYGSTGNGYYKFLNMTGMAALATFSPNSNQQGQLSAGPALAHIKMPILKIINSGPKYGNKVYFIVKQTVKYALIVEDAIHACEVLPCNESKSLAPGSSTADEIRKYKALMDDGIITKDEFESKKAELLKK